jgi:hypothetical protein
MNGTSGLRRLAGKVAAAFSEMNEAQHRAMVMRTALDRYLENPESSPDTYAEFLMRTSGVLLHEPPSAQRRTPGRRIRGA